MISVSSVSIIKSRATTMVACNRFRNVADIEEWLTDAFSNAVLDLISVT